MLKAHIVWIFDSTKQKKMNRDQTNTHSNERREKNTDALVLSTSFSMQWNQQHVWLCDQHHVKGIDEMPLSIPI